MAAPIAAAIVEAVTRRWGSTAARTAADGDGGDWLALSAREGLAPLAVLEPPDTATLAAMLRWADDEGHAIVPRGAGTKIAWGAAGARVDALLSLARLDAPVEHCSGDLTATVPAGATLRAVNDTLRRQGQWLPLDPGGSDRATIGGILATHDSGPRRHRYGSPRDLIIGIEMALADGRIAKAGGRVVKNVAGYDLSRLMCGSFGTLAVITGATFKLSPLAAASRTVVASVGDARQLGELVLGLAAAPLAPSAIELESPPHRVLIRFETTPAAADSQAAAARLLCDRHGAATVTLTAQEEALAWSEYRARIWDAPATLMKVAVLPDGVGDVLAWIERSAAARGLTARTGGRAALGILYCRLDGAVDRQPSYIGELRDEAVMRRGSLVVLSAPAAVRARVDPWGDLGDAFPIMRAVKARFDPKGTLSPGRGPGGL